MSDETYYSVLEISEAATPAEIKAAYHRLIREVHPDRLANAPAYWQKQAELKTQEINEAFSVLSKPAKRRTYDEQLDSYRKSQSPNSAKPTQPTNPPSSPSAWRPSNASSTANRNTGTKSRQQTGPTTAQYQNTTPKSANTKVSYPIDWKSRLFFASVCILFGGGATSGFWESGEGGDTWLAFWIAFAAFCCASYLYRHVISWFFARIGIRRRREQIWATSIVIVLGLIIGKVANMQSARSPSKAQYFPANQQQNNISAADNGTASTNTSGSSATEEFTVSNALTLLFGHYNLASHTSSVTIGGQRGTLRVLLDQPFSDLSDGAVTKHLLVTSTIPNGAKCHACGAVIGAYVFTNRAGRWVLDNADRDVLMFGAWGSAGTAKSIEFAPEVYGFSLTISEMAQGTEGTVEQFVAPVNGTYQPVLTVDLEDDDLGNCDSALSNCYQNKATTKFLKARRVFPNIETTRVGTRLGAGGKVVPANERVVYAFDGAKYVKLSNGS